MSAIFPDVKVVAFDAYGTLLDVHSAVARLRTRVGPQAEAVSNLWRLRQVEYTWLRSLMGAHADFAQVTADALDYAMEAHGLADPALRADLMEAYRSLAAYPEVPAVLGALMAEEMPACILSNGTPSMLSEAVSAAGIDFLLDELLSVESVGIYKPDRRVYQLVCDRYGVSPGQVCFVSSNGWDAAGAAAFGFQVAWVNRAGAPRERLPAVPAAELRDLSGLPALLGLGD